MPIYDLEHTQAKQTFPSPVPRQMKNLSSSTNRQLNATSRPTNPTEATGQRKRLETWTQGLDDLARLVSVVKFNLTYNSEGPATNSMGSNSSRTMAAEIVARTHKVSCRRGAGSGLRSLARGSNP